MQIRNLVQTVSCKLCLGYLSHPYAGCEVVTALAGWNYLSFTKLMLTVTP